MPAINKSITNTSKNNVIINTDVIVVGAGHAGCEAALACARSGFDTFIFTVSVDSIALMPCNPSVGGSSKGHLVRELDALGGEMGKVIDRTFIQSKMLNRSKGPAVHSLRAQADKAEYSREMRKILENQKHLFIKQAEVCELIWEDETSSSIPENSENLSQGIFSSNIQNHDKYTDNNTTYCPKKIVNGIRTATGTTYLARAVILCTGTYLNGRCLVGESITYTGPNGLQAATFLSDSLRDMGVELRRFKTGTPARIDKRSMDFSKMEPQYGDDPVVPFSFSTDPADVQVEQGLCYLTYTNEKTHEIIRNNLDRSPIYAGIIEGTGPRYCPSIEDKVVKFPDKPRHQLFIEPEGRHTNEMYISGMSSSLPEDVQIEMYRTVPGLENCRIVRNAYAIEYDCIDPNQLKLSLEFKNISGLFAAGQFNGSSGYEEAAAQGLIAGINAVKHIKKEEPLILDRSDAYIGVLIDDLVTKENVEPYRMMTSRAEYRLLLRQDNADLRLRKYGFEAGLVTEEQMSHLENKYVMIKDEIKRLSKTFISPSDELNDFLSQRNSTPLRSGISLAELLSRPELDYESLEIADSERRPLPAEVIEQVNIQIKYSGYIDRQERQIHQFKKMEKRLIPESIDYNEIQGLRIEAGQRLSLIRPSNIGQASRIAGVSPSDISVLLVYLEKY